MDAVGGNDVVLGNGPDIPTRKKMPFVIFLHFVPLCEKIVS